MIYSSKIENTIFLELGWYYRGYCRSSVVVAATPGVLHLLISFTSFAELGRRHVKKFYASICFIQYLGESSPHQPGYHSLAGLFNITIEPNTNLEYSWHVRSVSPWFVFFKWYMLL
jgi:hypothetical protein